MGAVRLLTCSHIIRKKCSGSTLAPRHGAYSNTTFQNHAGVKTVRAQSNETQRAKREIGQLIAEGPWKPLSGVDLARLGRVDVLHENGVTQIER